MDVDRYGFNQTGIGCKLLQVGFLGSQGLDRQDHRRGLSEGWLGDGLQALAQDNVG